MATREDLYGAHPWLSEIPDEGWAELDAAWRAHHDLRCSLHWRRGRKRFSAAVRSARVATESQSPADVLVSWRPMMMSVEGGTGEDVEWRISVFDSAEELVCEVRWASLLEGDVEGQFSLHKVVNSLVGVLQRQHALLLGSYGAADSIMTTATAAFAAGQRMQQDVMDYALELRSEVARWEAAGAAVREVVDLLKNNPGAVRDILRDLGFGAPAGSQIPPDLPAEWTGLWVAVQTRDAGLARRILDPLSGDAAAELARDLKASQHGEFILHGLSDLLGWGLSG